VAKTATVPDFGPDFGNTASENTIFICRLLNMTVDD
jgi:hypothetical protein